MDRSVVSFLVKSLFSSLCCAVGAALLLLSTYIQTSDVICFPL